MTGVPEYNSKFANEFTVSGILGVGGFGIVFEATSAEDGQKYAVKRISVDSVDEQMMPRARREVDAMQRLQHPGIVRMKAHWIETPTLLWQIFSDHGTFSRFRPPSTPVQQRSGTTATYIYIQMQLGRCSLSDRLEEMGNSPRDPSLMWQWFKQILSALAYIHSKGLMHRDLMPSNILFGADERLMICDLGVVNHTRHRNGAEVTASYTNIGNSLYRAPEQGELSVYTSKVDVFALGLILAELSENIEAKKAEIFNKYRSGKQNNILQDKPATATFIEWLTRVQQRNRPTCRDIQCLLLSAEEPEGAFTWEEYFNRQVISETIIQNIPDETDFQPFSSRFSNEFEVNSVIGEGGFGCVFEVTHKVDRCRYAVKRIPVRTRTDTTSLSESQILARMDHIGIVRYNNTWIERPPPGWQHNEDLKIFEKIHHEPRFLQYRNESIFIFIQMQLCKCSLADWLQQNAHQSARSLDRMKSWFKQMTSAVAYIHDQGIIHRDLKPGNILFTDDDRLKICDLGISTDIRIGALEARASSVANDDEGIEVDWTRTNIGTRLYMSPEQIADWSKYGSKTDVFTLGLILAELCITMTRDERAEIFENYRKGQQCDRVEDDGIATIIRELTAWDPQDRPTCKDILRSPFLA